MKKIFSFILMIAMSISILTACEKANTANVVAKDLNNNLNTLSTTVNKLDTVDNKYLSNPDIYSSVKPEENNFVALAFNENTNTTFNETVKKALIDKITDKLISQDSTCNTSDCYTCDKYCDEDGNCYYTDCNGNNYCYNKNGECSDCDNIPESCKYIGQTKISCESESYDDLKVEQISTTVETSLDQQDTNSQEETTLNKELENNSSNNEENNILSTPNPRIYYFTQDSFSPVRLKYNPRFINKYSESTINDQIENYLLKVQKLYAMSEDSIEANTILQKCKIDIIDCIKEIQQLNECILNGKCEPSVQELQALSNYIIDIKTTTKRLKDCNGELTKEVANISESNTNSMINSVDVMNSNYMRLLNHIDTRVTYHRSAIATLEQIKYLLDNATNSNQISDEEIEDIIENISNNDFIQDKLDNNESNDIATNDSIIDSGDSFDNNNNIDNDTYYEDTVNKYIDENNIENNSDINSEIYNDTFINDETTNEESSIIETSNNDSPTTDIESSNLENVEESNSDTQNNSNIDSYNTVSSWSNIDTYKPTENLDDNSSNIVEEDLNETDNIDNSIINETPTISEETFTSDNIENQTTDNEETINSNNATLDDIDTNEIINNNLNNNVVSETSNSGMYKNSIITQNNLNNDNGYGGYYYTSDGEIKNNSINNNNELGNNGNTIENNTNKNNNVNTYGYNTMLDILNQGTVNNGINTL